MQRVAKTSIFYINALAKEMLERMCTEKAVIIIPTYNEASIIEETLEKVFQTTSSISTASIHILVFDSASTDNTRDIVSRLQTQYPQLHLLEECKKSGLGSAYLQAMTYALNDMSADILIEFDADLSHQPKYLKPMLELLNTHEVVIGSRYIPGGSIPQNWGWHRKLLSRIGNLIARVLLTSKYKDFTSGFRATRRQVLAKTLPLKFLSNHYAYKLQLLWLLHKNKARIIEYPIAFIDRTKGESKLPANSIFDSLRVLLLLRFFELKRYFKMCLVGLSGMVVQCLVYNILRQSLVPFNAAQFAVMAAIINNFTLNSRFTFRKNALGNPAKKIKSFLLFIVCSILMISFQSHWQHLGVKYFGTGYLKENLIMLSGIVLGSFINYLTYSRLLWPDKKTLDQSTVLKNATEQTIN